MTPASFPLFFQLLATDAGEFEAALSPARIERVRKAVEALCAAHEAGSIANPVFKDIKDALNRAMEGAWKRIARPGFGWRGETKTAPDAVIDACDQWEYPTAHKFAGTLRRVEKCTVEHPVRTACLDYLREIQPMAEAINFLKDHTVKRQPKSEEEKAAAFRAPPSSSKAVARARAPCWKKSWPVTSRPSSNR